MKRLLSTVLLAFMVFGAWAQNKTKMTEEEVKRPWKDLKRSTRWRQERYSAILIHCQKTKSSDSIDSLGKNGRANSNTRKRVCQYF